ncbi:hypothetical protein [Streptomyces sp. NPDC059247]|uniref:hypothetical protein n=1 Tax=Streptomyces sp. NPDC059247 TaxID=3346790 RepID=UPI0036BAF5EB
MFVGKTPPPSEVGEDETLMADLPSACRMIAHACDAYADHIETAPKKIPDEESPLFGEPLAIWGRPQFGGEGHDGGLRELVTGDMRIAHLGNIPPAPDSPQVKVPMPQPDGGGSLPFPPLPPFLAPLIRVPLLVRVGYRPLNGPRVQPISPTDTSGPVLPHSVPLSSRTFRHG